jgi:predicted P-loop ATPase
LQASRTNNSCEHSEGAPHRGGAVQRTEGVCWGEATELTDQHVNSLYCRFCLDTGRQAKISDFYIIIESDFYPEYHPLREYLESLPAWNGIDYIDQVASMVHVTGCTQEMHNRFFKQWLVAMVAAWLEPDKTNHEILTYIGPQGIYKSTFVRHLLPPELSAYFSTKNFAGRMTKDDRLELTEMALISLEELDSLQSAELNQLKAITTDPTVNERAAFARYKERRAHIASFCGTGNNPRFLTDLTDNRRWLPFLVRDIDSPWTHPMPYAGMYSQAYTLYRTGFRYWFDADDNAELQRHNRQFEEPCMEEELIATYLRVPYGDEVGEFLTATRIIELIGGAVKRPLSAKKVALCMNRLGFEARRIRNVRGWNVVILTGNDIKEEQRLNAHRSVED